jgi:hypothetical protein
VSLRIDPTVNTIFLKSCDGEKSTAFQVSTLNISSLLKNLVGRTIASPREFTSVTEVRFLSYWSHPIFNSY